MTERLDHGGEIPPADEFFPVTRTYGEEEVLVNSHFCTRLGQDEELLGWIGIYGRYDLFEIIYTPFSFWGENQKSFETDYSREPFEITEISDKYFAECLFEDERQRLEGTGGLTAEFAHRRITGKATWSTGEDREVKDVGYHGQVFGIEFEGLTSKETEMRFKAVVDAHLDSSS